MSEEIREIEKKECKCFCHSEGFRKFLVVALGSFVGVYAALCLFTALHRPPMMPPMAGPYGFHGGCPCAVMKHHHNHFNGDRAKDFQKQLPKEGVRRAPFEAPNPVKN